MSRRSRAREVVLQVLYQQDLCPGGDIQVLEEFFRGRLHEHGELIEFARGLFFGVMRNREEIDKLLAARADNWSLERMAVTDRNILRLGAYEIAFTDTPDRVAINEAVELSKRFGSKASPPFVNGVLDRFLREYKNRETKGPAGAEAEPPPKTEETS